MYVRDILSSKLKQFDSQKNSDADPMSLDWLPEPLRSACRSLKIDSKNWVIGVNNQAALYWLNVQKGQWKQFFQGRSVSFVRVI